MLSFVTYFKMEVSWIFLNMSIMKSVSSCLILGDQWETLMIQLFEEYSTIQQNSCTVYKDKKI